MELLTLVATLFGPTIAVVIAAFLTIYFYNRQKRKDTVILFLSISSSDPDIGKYLNAIRTQFISHKEIQKEMDVLLGSTFPGMEYSNQAKSKSKSLEKIRKICAVEIDLCSEEESNNFDFTREFK